MRAIGRDPLFVDRAEGAELVDVDGNRYVDYVCSWGPLIHGHAHPEILAAIRAPPRRARRSARPTAMEVDLADEVARAHAVRADAAHDLLGHRGGHERDPPRPRPPRAATSS
jgi:glutamate-1-semialdehyde 2,1-aminomutase